MVPYQNQSLVLADLASGRLDASLQDAIQADEGFLKKPEGKGFAFAGGNLNDPKTLVPVPASACARKIPI